MELSRSLIVFYELFRYVDPVLGNGTSFTSFNLRDWPAFENSIVVSHRRVNIFFQVHMFVYICGKQNRTREAKGRIVNLTRVWDEIGVLMHSQRIIKLIDNQFIERVALQNFHRPTHAICHEK